MTAPVTEQPPTPAPDETTWDPEGERLAARAPVTETADEPAPRGFGDVG